MERGENFRRFVPEAVEDSHVAFENEIWRVINGSQLYGTATTVSDEDQLGVFIEPLEYVVGFKRMDDYTWRSKPEGVRAEAGDTEISLYSLRKFMNLLIAGNPSILATIYARDELVVHDRLDLRIFQEPIASKKAYPRFKGYLHSQKERALGIKQGHKARRDELVGEFGYDTKYMMHAIRLGLQGIEYLETGRISSPSKDAQWLLAIRNGEYTEQECLDYIDRLLIQLDDAVEKSTLPDEPDYKTLTDLMITWHEWMWKGWIL